MQMLTLNTSPTFFEHDKADEIAATMNADDDDWTYVVDHTGERWARVEIIDEDGESVGYL